MFVKKEGILLSKTNLEFENEAVLNPAAIRDGDSVHLFYRAVKRGNHSSIGYCRLDGPLTITAKLDKPILIPEFDYESRGVEDARITKIDGTYYMTYTAYDGINARSALATSDDLAVFKKHGIIVSSLTYADLVSLIKDVTKVNDNYYNNSKTYEFYNRNIETKDKMVLWDKNVIFFPRKINGKLTFLQRIRPGIQLVSVNSLNDLTDSFWKDYFVNIQDHIILDPVYQHESSFIGGGCPPIETKHGWLLIYHGVEITYKGLIYSACAALLDINNPLKEIARLPYALFSPELDWELNGLNNNVVYPTGTVIFGNTLFIYYGAAGTRIACASVNINDLVAELLSFTRPNMK